MPVVLLKTHARTSQYCCVFHTFCVCTVYSLMLSLILHKMALLLHKNGSYCIKHVWCLCKFHNKNFMIVCCTTLRQPGAGKGRGERQLLQFTNDSSLSVTIASSLNYQVSQVGRACILDLDSGALALTTQTPGNSRVLLHGCPQSCMPKPCRRPS